MYNIVYYFNAGEDQWNFLTYGIALPSYIIAIIILGFFMHKYINNLVSKLKSIVPRRKKGQSEEEYDQIVKEWVFRAGIAALMAAALISSVTAIAGKTVTVSNSVNGKELPIYCVETNKKQVALTFDAACGDAK